MVEKKINFEMSLTELEIVLNCLMGTFSCPLEHSDFVNRVFKACRENGVKFNLKAYC